MRRITYDFSGLENVFDGALARGDFKPQDLAAIKQELNRFFRDSTCTQVFYTINTDKPFFGIIVNASIDEEQIYEYLMGTKDIRISKYNLEFDSHLLNPVLGLTAREMVAMTLHEIGHVVNDATPVTNARRYLDEYLAKNNETIKVADSMHYRSILAYALKDFITKDRSMFYSNDVDEIMADDFVRSYGYGPDLESAMSKILKSNAKLYSSNVDKFSAFAWTLGIYRHLGTRRIPAIRTLNKARALTGSRIELMAYDALIKRISRVDDYTLMEAGGSKLSISTKIKDRMRKMRINNMRSLEDDFYELNMRIRNVEDEDDALYLMRQINTRISIIQDFVDSEELSSSEAKRWNESLTKFKRLREDLSKTLVYKGKSYGLYVPYPEIKPDNY